MKMFKGTKGMIILFLLVAMVVGYYFYLSNRPVPEVTDEVSAEILTESQKALNRNLESNYPPSPREVVKYFSEITSCYYNEEHTDEELRALGLKMREIYDDALVANQTEEIYLELLRQDVEDYKQNKRTITNFSPSSSVDVETFTKDGYECAKLYCVYDIKQDTLLYQTTLCFILRKDEDSHYKIFGWKMINPDKQ